MSSCSCCFSLSVDPLLDLGLQPISNRFLKSSHEQENLFPFGISLCSSCGLITLSHPLPYQKLQPRVPWISYQEPEAHLEKLTQYFLSTFPSFSKSSSILGLSYHDEAVLEQFRKKGFLNSRTLSFENDFALSKKGLGIETIQALLTPTWSEEFLRKNKLQELIIARSILEHVQDISSFLKAIKTILHPEGYILFEIPDFSLSLKQYEYSNLWEEHFFYFTPLTIQRLLNNHGFVIRECIIQTYPLEYSMSIVCQLNPTAKQQFSEASDEEIKKATAYADHFIHQRSKLHALFQQWSKEGKIVLFGAGHLAIKWINFFDLSKYFSFVVDDHPHKSGYFLPGSHLPIKSAKALLEEKVHYCILSVNPEREDKILQNSVPFLAKQNITIYSLFRTSSKRLPIHDE